MKDDSVYLNMQQGATLMENPQPVCYGSDRNRAIVHVASMRPAAWSVVRFMKGCCLAFVAAPDSVIATVTGRTAAAAGVK